MPKAYVGRDCALVKSMPFNQSVVGSNPALAATKGPWASPSLAVACSASTCKLRHSVNCCGRERFWKVYPVRSAIEIDKYNTICGRPYSTREVRLMWTSRGSVKNLDF